MNFKDYLAEKKEDTDIEKIISILKKHPFETKYINNIKKVLLAAEKTGELQKTESDMSVTIAIVSEAQLAAEYNGEKLEKTIVIKIPTKLKTKSYTDIAKYLITVVEKSAAGIEKRNKKKDRYVFFDIISHIGFEYSKGEIKEIFSSELEKKYL